MCPKEIWSQEVFLEYMLYTGVMSNLEIFINFTYEDSMHFYKKNIHFLEDQTCSSFVLKDDAKQCSSDLQWAPQENTPSALRSRNALPQPPAATFALGCTSSAAPEPFSDVSGVWNACARGYWHSSLSPPKF